MSARKNTVVGVVFGGRSVEHDVSVVTGQQIMRAFPADRYEVVPIYIDRDGRWFTGEPLKDLKTFQDDVRNVPGVAPITLSPDVRQHGLIVNPLPTGLLAKPQPLRLDVVFPAIHGSHGEDGTLQGLLELADIPYAGCGVLASAVANDKWLTKVVLKQHGIAVVDGLCFSRHEWETAPDALVAQIKERFEYPVFIKPATLGSSIGIGRADNDALLRASIDVAASLDRRIIIEPAILNCVEINGAVLGDDRELRASVLEQPVSWEEFLTYEEKYLRGGEGMKSAERIIPAPLEAPLTERIQDTAKRAFRAIDGRGIARIDFLVRPKTGEVFLNEINTLPGSLSFYLWQDTGMSAAELVEALVKIGRDAHAEKHRNTYNYRTNLIALSASRGLKGTKGSKGAH
ncbi:MAG TPA: D-alanine--D-alanine ligase family protein [Candidatus Limnocylindrales bacterium]|nr:D-alanine--D-alanine ligase family protein [Candidatus Limnocylindrales bacterium]